MKDLRTPLCLILAVCLPTIVTAAQGQAASPASAPDAVLNAPETTKLLPPAVFFRGQSAPVQSRNSAGIKFSDGALVLAMLVDNSGYSTAVQQKYQAYVIAETPIEINLHRLAPGAYGVGFVEGHFGVMDIGGHDLFSVDANRDAELKRPTPLQILTDSSAKGYRLYQGRDYVVITHPVPTP